MPRIGVMAPNALLLDQTFTAAAELGLEGDIRAEVSTVWNALECAKSMIADGAEVIVARGTTADFLMRSAVPATIVPITMSCQDLQQAVLSAQTLTGLASPRIAVMSVRVMNQDVKLYAKALGVDLRIYPMVGTLESIDAAIEAMNRDNPDVVMGGFGTMRLAEEDGYPVMPLPSSVESMKIFLGEAATVVRAVTLEHARTKRFQTLVGHLREGVLYVEPTGRIRIVNPAAEVMLGRPARELCSMRIDDVLTLPGLSECLVGITETAEEILTIGGSTLIVTMIPAHVGREPSGVIISLQETNRISQMDARIRKNQNTRGLAASYRFDDIRGSSPAIRETKRLAAEYAPTDSTVLIFGETGTGKELFAQSIHNAGRQAGGPFVAVNCAALPPSLLESELFGYEEGAFTGANRRGKAGLIELAHNGTLFLDEVSEMDHYGQVRLLRFLQERQIMRLSGDRYIPVRTRVIAATNRDLGALVARREFREDLYYRLKVLTLTVPPLREREGDAARLIEMLRQEWEERLGRRIRFSPEALPLLREHRWPGNVRELTNVMENLAVASGRSIISAAAVRQVLMTRLAAGPAAAPEDSAPAPAGPLPDGERSRILRALTECGGSKSRAASALGIHRTTLHRKMLAHGITLEPK